jgi:hypothetical protein
MSTVTKEQYEAVAAAATAQGLTVAVNVSDDVPWGESYTSLIISDRDSITRDQTKAFDADLESRGLYVVDLIPRDKITIVLENRSVRGTSESYASKNGLAFDGYDTPDRLYQFLFGRAA